MGVLLRKRRNLLDSILACGGLGISLDGCQEMGAVFQGYMFQGKT